MHLFQLYAGGGSTDLGLYLWGNRTLPTVQGLPPSVDPYGQSLIIRFNLWCLPPGKPKKNKNNLPLWNRQVILTKLSICLYFVAASDTQETGKTEVGATRNADSTSLVGSLPPRVVFSLNYYSNWFRSNSPSLQDDCWMRPENGSLVSSCQLLDWMEFFGFKCLLFEIYFIQQ